MPIFVIRFLQFVTGHNFNCCHGVYDRNWNIVINCQILSYDRMHLNFTWNTVSTQYKKTRNINSQQQKLLLHATFKFFLDLFNKLNTMHWESLCIIGNEYRLNKQPQCCRIYQPGGRTTPIIVHAVVHIYIDPRCAQRPVHSLAYALKNIRIILRTI